MKFDADPDDELPSFADLGGSDWRSITLTATYWDTPDRRILSLGCSLRHRVASDGSETGWTLKVPAAGGGGDVVSRHEVNRTGESDEPPAELLALLRTALLGGSPQPVATIITHRSSLRLAGSDGAASVEISDDRVDSEADGRPGPSFREVEVEVVGDGSRALLGEVRARLEAAGLELGTDRSKVRRVLGPRPSLLESPKRLPGDATVREFLAATIGASTRQLLIHDPGVRLGGDVEAIHAARVAIRRLRSDVKTFRPLLVGEVVDRLREELGWLGDLLGNVRDPQVLQQGLAEHAASLEPVAGMDDAAMSDLTERLVDLAQFHHTQLIDAMDGDRYRGLVADLLTMSNRPPVVSEKVGSRAAAPIAERLAKKQWRRAHKFAAGLGPDANDVELHEVRKRLKRARYASQSLRRVRSGKKQFRRSLAELQDLLGDHHDLVVQREFLAANADRLGPAASFVSGRLLQDADHRRQAMRAEWPRIADRLDQLDFD